MKVGDKVDIYWEQIAPEMNVEIFKEPNNVGDSWGVLRSDGTEVYVCLFSKMVKRQLFEKL